MATCEFKIGDIVRRIKIDNNWGDGRALKVGTICTVVDFDRHGDVIVKVGDEIYAGNCNDFFELVMRKSTPNFEDKIVITHDGKTTTATLYRGDGSKEQATARCAPEDIFDFNVGAKLALERLTEKTTAPVEWRVVNRAPRVGDYIRIIANTGFDFDNIGDIRKVDVVNSNTLVAVYQKNHPTSKHHNDPNFEWNYLSNEYEIVEKVTVVTRDGFKVGDRVNYNGHNGTVICIQDLTRNTPTPIGVEFDTYLGYNHNCDYFKLADGKVGTTGRCGWYGHEELKHGEAPKYYNGKVVCISDEYRWWTKGKIYTFVNGTVVDEDGTVRYSKNRVADITSMNHIFLPVVE